MRLVSQMFPGKFLKAIDLVDDALFTIKSVDQETFTKNDGTKEKKLVVTFQETTQKLSLNVINRSTLVDLFGDDVDAWPGHAICLYSTPCQGPSGMTEGIRIRQTPRRPAPRTGGRSGVLPMGGPKGVPPIPPVSQVEEDGEEEESGF